MSELRYDPIRKSWVIIAAERSLRPSDHLRSGPVHEHGPTGSCPFCPGNEKSTPPETYALRKPETLPDTPGWQIRVVPNKFPALDQSVPLQRSNNGLYDVTSGFGVHEVLVETPDADRQMDTLSLRHLGDVFIALRGRIEALKMDRRLHYIMAFKNYGREAGASLFHSHSQIIGIPVIPNLISAELASFREHFRAVKSCLMCDIISQEAADIRRIVAESKEFISFVPYSSGLPFEVRIAPKAHSHDFVSATDTVLRSFARIVRETLRRLKKVLDDPPYNFVLHTSPPAHDRAGKPGFWKSIEQDYHWYLELVPRTTMIAGFEWGTGFYINTTRPEDAAALLRSVDI